MKKIILIVGALLLLGCEQEVDSWTITKKTLTNFWCQSIQGYSSSGKPPNHYFQIDTVNNIFFVWQDVAEPSSSSLYTINKKPKWSQGIGFTTHKLTKADRLNYTGNLQVDGMPVGTSYIKGFLPENHSLKWGTTLIPPSEWRTTGEFVINKASLEMWICYGGQRLNRGLNSLADNKTCNPFRYMCGKYFTQDFQSFFDDLRSRYSRAIEEQRVKRALEKEAVRDKF
jgi:hypothetical protein